MIFAVITFLAGIALAVVESTFVKAAGIAGICPDLAVLVVIVATCSMGFSRAMVLAFMLGLARDFYSAGALGMSSLSLTLTAFLLVMVEDYLLTDNWNAQIFVVFLGSLIYGSLLVVLKLIVGYEITSLFLTLKIIVWTSVYTSALGALSFALVKNPEPPPYRRLKMKYDVEHETLHQTKI